MRSEALAAHGKRSTAFSPTSASHALWLKVPSSMTPTPFWSMAATNSWNSVMAWLPSAV